MKLLNIAFSNGKDDKKAWSGTVYKTFIGLLNISEQTDFLPIKNIPFPWGLRTKYFLYRVSRKFGFAKHIYLPTFSLAYRDAVERNLKAIDFSGYDVLFVTASSVIANALLHTLHEEDKRKVVFLADTPFCGIEDYYPTSTNLYHRNSVEANNIGRYVFTHVSKIIVSSQWAKDMAVKNYGANPSAISVIEFGANIDSPVLGTRTVSFAEKKELNIFLSGVDWQRKGGIAVACCQAILHRGYAIELHIVGMPVPPQYKDYPFIHEYGFLNKNIPEEYQQYLNILEQMDIFLFPSRAECSATVLCEAAGYGLPTFCYDTGGVGNYVQNDYNGLRLPLSATGEDFATAIIHALETNKMDTYSKNAQHLYQAKLNWTVWSERVRKILLS